MVAIRPHGITTTHGLFFLITVVVYAVWFRFQLIVCGFVISVLTVCLTDVKDTTLCRDNNKSIQSQSHVHLPFVTSVRVYTTTV